MRNYIDGPASVLHLGKYYPPHMGGMEIYLQQLIVHQAKTMNVAAIVAGDSCRTRVEFLDGAKITRVATVGSIASMPVMPTLALQIHRQRAELIHLNTPNPGAAFALQMSGDRGKLIITHHGDTLGRKGLRWISDPFVRSAMERAAAIIVTSERYLAGSEELIPFRKKCRVVPLGIDPAPFENANAAAIKNIQAKYGKRLILAVGRLVPFKGFEYLIRAMEHINGTLLLVGTGRLQGALRAIVAKCGLQNKVWMIDSIDNATISPFYCSASVFAMPSVTRAESFGIVQLEAMAAGIPVVNTDIPSGVPEVSLHGQTGLTVPPKDPAALARAINLLLDDNELRHRFGAAARERVRRHFSLERMLAETMAIYEDVIAGREMKS
jgi:glycosyltransferase involved in cell wall biosynthesis